MSLLNQGQPAQTDTGMPQGQQEPQGTPTVDWEKRYKDLHESSCHEIMQFSRTI